MDLDELAFIDMSGVRMVLAAAGESSRGGWLFAATAGAALVSLDRPLPLDGFPA